MREGDHNYEVCWRERERESQCFIDSVITKIPITLFFHSVIMTFDDSKVQMG